MAEIAFALVLSQPVPRVVILPVAGNSEHKARSPGKGLFLPVALHYPILPSLAGAVSAHRISFLHTLIPGDGHLLLAFL